MGRSIKTERLTSYAIVSVHLNKVSDSFELRQLEPEEPIQPPPRKGELGM